MSTCVSARSATFATNFWKVSLRATKSVSALTSITAPTLPLTATPMSPSAAVRPAFFAAAAKPFLRSQSTAFSRLPSVSDSARLQSIMPAPVFSRSSLTSPAEISAILASVLGVGLCFGVGAARIAMRRGRQLLAHFLGGADIDAGRDCLGLETVEHGARDEIAVEVNGAHCVVVAGDRIGDAGGIGIAVEHRDHRDLQLVRLLDGDRLFIGVDHEDDVGQAAHLLDAAERALELVAIARDLQ